MAIKVSEIQSSNTRLSFDPAPTLSANLDTDGNSILNGQGNVDISGLLYPVSDGADRDVLMSDGAGNITLQTIAFDDLSDIDMSTVSPVEADVLIYDGNTFNWIPTTTKIGANAFILYVSDVDGNDTSGNGSELAPFKSISRAMSDIGDGTLGTILTEFWIVNVTTGVYLEDIFIPELRNITFISSGVVFIGHPDSPGLGGNCYIPHNDIPVGDSLAVTFTNAYLTLTATFRPEATGTFGGWNFNNDIVYEAGNDIAGPTGTFGLHVWGIKADKIRVNGTHVIDKLQLLIEIGVVNEIYFPDALLTLCRDMTIGISLETGTYERIINSELNGPIIFNTGLTTSQEALPNGFLTTIINNNVTMGLSAPVPMDDYTWRSFKDRSDVSGYTINGISPSQAVDDGIIEIIASSELGKLVDVDYASLPSSGDILRFDGLKWFPDIEAGASAFVDGVYWTTPPTINKDLRENGKTVESLVSEWSNVISDSAAIDDSETEGNSKRYLEIHVGQMVSNLVEVGFALVSVTDYVIQPSTAPGYVSIDYNTNQLFSDGSPVLTFGSFTLDAISSSSILQIAYDISSRQVWIGLDGVYEGGVDPSTGTNETITLSSNPYELFASPFALNGQVRSPEENTYEQPTGFFNLKSAPQIRGRFEDLDDVTVVNPNNLQYIGYDSGEWVNRQVGYEELLNPIGIEGLTDVTITSVTLNDVISWNGSAWINTPPTSNVNSLDDLTDVTISTPLDNQILQYNDLNTQWENVTIVLDNTLASLDDTDISIVKNTGEALQWSGTIWINEFIDYNTLSNLPSIPVTIDDLSDVDTTTVSPTTLESTLQWNGVNWVPVKLPVNSDFTLVGLFETSNIAVSNGYLRWNSAGNTVSYETSIPASVIVGLADVAISGSYNDLSNQPAIPTNSDFTFRQLSDTSNVAVQEGYLRWNSSGTLVIYEATIDVSIIAGLADVATSGSYDDLSNKPTIPVNSDFSLVGLSDTDVLAVSNGYLRWNDSATRIDYETTIAASDTTGFATVATSGDYTDLSNAPFIPDVMNDLSDVDITGVTINQGIKWNGANWVPDDDIDTDTIAELTDTIITTPASQNVLLWNGSAWINSFVDYSDVTNTPAAPVSSDFTLAGLSDTTGVSVNSGYLQWSVDGTLVQYVTTIPASVVTGLATVAITGNYNDLFNQPTIPVNISDLADVVTSGNQDNQMLTWSGTVWNNQFVNYTNITNTPDLSIYAEITSLESVAFDGLFDSLVDIDVTTAINGDSIVFNTTSGNWEAGLPNATVALLGDIGDVNLAGVTDGQVIKWNDTAGEWQPANDLQGGGGGGAESLGELNDVTLAGLVDRNYLIYDFATSQWRNLVPDYNDLSNTPVVPAVIDDLGDVDTTTVVPEEFDVLIFSGSEWIPTHPISVEDEKIINVMETGSDTTGDGSRFNPFASVKKAVEVAEALATTSNDKVGVQIGSGTYSEDNPVTISDWRVSVSANIVYSVDIVATNPGPVIILSTQSAAFGATISGFNIIGLSSAAGNNGVEADGDGIFILDRIRVENCDKAISATATVPNIKQTISYGTGVIKLCNTGLFTRHPLSQVLAANVALLDIFDVSVDADQGTLQISPVQIDNAATKSGGVVGLRVGDGRLTVFNTTVRNCDMAVELLGDGNLYIVGLTIRDCNAEWDQPVGSLAESTITAITVDLAKSFFSELSLYRVATHYRFGENYIYTIASNGRTVEMIAGSVQARYGTAASPSFIFGENDGTFVGDPTTGFYSPSAGFLAFSTDGIDRMTISSTGTVNISTAFTIQGSPLDDVALSGDYNDLINAPLVPTVISDLTDVDTTGVTTNQLLVWNGSTWIAGDDVNTDTFDDLTDTLFTSLTTGNAALWNGSVWVNDFVDYSDVTNTPSTPVSSDFSLVGLSDTATPSVNDGYLKWNASGTQVQYFATIPSTSITGLATVATTGTIGSLIDVDETGVGDGDILRYSGAGAEWLAETPVLNVTSVFTRTGAIIAVAGDYEDTEIVNTSTVTGGTVAVALTALNDDKANKVGGATSGNLAGLSGTGNLTDSGSKVSDFATSAQGALADSALQSGDNISVLTNNTGYITSITSESVGDLADVDITGILDGEVLVWNATAVEFQPGEGGGGGGGTITSAATYYADMLQSPNNSDWAVNSFADYTPDPIYPSILVRGFDDTTVEGVGFTMPTTGTDTTLDLVIKGRPSSSSSSTVIMRLYAREIPDNAVVPSWATAVTSMSLSLNGNANFAYYSFNFNMGTIGLNAGSTYLFELVRQSSSGSDTLTGDFNMVEIQLGFS